MYCKKCGAQVRDDAQFCLGCGAQLREPVKVQEVNFNESYNKKPVPARKSKKKPGKALIGIAAVVAVVAVVVLLASLLLGGPTAKVSKALVKSGTAFADAFAKTGFDNAGDLFTQKEMSQVFSFQLDEFPGVSDLDGIGMRVAVDSDLPGRVINTSVSPFIGSSDLLNLQLKMKDDAIYLGCPEVTGDTYYMVHTTTIGAELEELLDVDDLSEISINLFDLVEEMQKLAPDQNEQKKAIGKAFAEFVKTISVEKAGKETVEVNDHSLKCTAYHVVISEDAVTQLLESLEEITDNADVNEEYLSLLESKGLPAEIVDAVEDALDESTRTVKNAYDSIYDLAEEFGDIELELYINKGYIVAAVTEISVDGEEMEVILNIGGGENYVDDISLRMTVDDEELSIVSSGNHTGSGDAFTDSTVMKLDTSSGKQTLAEMELSYSPKADSDNFEWSLEVDGTTLEAEGQVSCSKNALSIDLDRFEVDNTAAIALSYSIGKYEGDNIKPGETLDLGKMSEDELMEAVEELSENLMSWATYLMEEYPDLAYLF